MHLLLCDSSSSKQVETRPTKNKMKKPKQQLNLYLWILMCNSVLNCNYVVITVCGHLCSNNMYKGLPHRRVIISDLVH